MASKRRARNTSAFLRFLKRITAFFRKPDSGEDPYAYVGAPKKPRPPYRSAAAVAELPERW